MSHLWVRSSNGRLGFGGQEERLDGRGAQDARGGAGEERGARESAHLRRFGRVRNPAKKGDLPHPAAAAVNRVAQQRRLACGFCGGLWFLRPHRLARCPADAGGHGSCCRGRERPGERGRERGVVGLEAATHALDQGGQEEQPALEIRSCQVCDFRRL